MHDTNNNSSEEMTGVVDLQMATVFFPQFDRRIDVAIGENLLFAALREGIDIYHACGMNSVCTTCRVIVKRGAECLSRMNNSESSSLEFSPERTTDSRLSCQCVVMAAGEIEIEIPE